MTDHSPDMRVIEPTAEKYNATLVKREDDNGDLARFWVRADGEASHFEPGQYMTIGVYADDKLYQRPYSVAKGRANRPNREGASIIQSRQQYARLRRRASGRLFWLVRPDML